MTSDNSEAIALFQKQQLEKLDAEVPEILQQMDVKILLQHLKGNPNGSTVNIINVGKVESAGVEGNGDQTKLLIDRLLDEISDLKAELKTVREFGIMEWTKALPQPRFKSLIRSLVMTLRENFTLQREAAEFLGVSERQFSYWMKTHKIHGYRPRKDYRRKEE